MIDLAQPGPCLLCGSLGDCGGVLTTTDRTLGTPEGKTRMIFYSLCSSCFGPGQAPDAGQVERIEKVIRFNLSAGEVRTRSMRALEAQK